MAGLRTILFGCCLMLAAVPYARSEEGGGHKEKKSEEKEGGKSSQPAQESFGYVKSWTPMIPFSAAKLPGAGEQEHIQSKPGRMLVVIFLASWCEPCQQLMPELLRMDKHYRRLNTDFVYVFTHDTREDAEGFQREFKLDHGYLANLDIMKIFHNPELMSIWVGDRHGYLIALYSQATKEDLAKLDILLRDLTAY